MKDHYVIGKLYMWNGLILFLGSVNDTAFHRHNAIQLVLGLNKKFTLKTTKTNISTTGVVIGPNVEHRLEGESGIQALLLIENGSFFYKQIESLFQNENMINMLDEHIVSKSKEIFNIFLNQNVDSIQVYNEIKAFIQFLGGSKEKNERIDQRIEKSKEIINNMEIKKISASRIAKEIYLSESRFLHLFKKEIGIPFRRYLLWKRMLDSINILIDKKDITFAAHQCGFADSAHLARTFKDNFGVTISEIFKNDRFVQVFIDSRM